MIFQGPLSELQSFQQKASRIAIKSSDNETAFKLLQEYQPEMEQEAVSVPFENWMQVAEINRKLIHHNLDVYLLHPQKSDLEQLFIDLTTTSA